MAVECFIQPRTFVNLLLKQHSLKERQRQGAASFPDGHRVLQARAPSVRSREESRGGEENHHHYSQEHLDRSFLLCISGNEFNEV